MQHRRILEGHSFIKHTWTCATVCQALWMVLGFYSLPLLVCRWGNPGRLSVRNVELKARATLRLPVRIQPPTHLTIPTWTTSLLPSICPIPVHLSLGNQRDLCKILVTPKIKVCIVARCTQHRVPKDFVCSSCLYPPSTSSQRSPVSVEFRARRNNT